MVRHSVSPPSVSNAGLVLVLVSWGAVGPSSFHPRRHVTSRHVSSHDPDRSRASIAAPVANRLSILTLYRPPSCACYCAYTACYSPFRAAALIGRSAPDNAATDRLANSPLRWHRQRSSPRALVSATDTTSNCCPFARRRPLSGAVWGGVAVVGGLRWPPSVPPPAGERAPRPRWRASSPRASARQGVAAPAPVHTLPPCCPQLPSFFVTPAAAAECAVGPDTAGRSLWQLQLLTAVVAPVLRCHPGPHRAFMLMWLTLPPFLFL